MKLTPYQPENAIQPGPAISTMTQHGQLYSGGYVLNLLAEAHEHYEAQVRKLGESAAARIAELESAAEELLFSAHHCGSSAYHARRVMEILGPGQSDLADEVIQRESDRHEKYTAALLNAGAPAVVHSAPEPLDTDKAMHHCISSAAVLAHRHAAIGIEPATGPVATQPVSADDSGLTACVTCGAPAGVHAVPESRDKAAMLAEHMRLVDEALCSRMASAADAYAAVEASAKRMLGIES